jgi:peptidoglycan-N-acetylglucosamine deacetylase
MNKKIAIVLLIIFLLVVLCVFFQISKSRTFQFFGGLIYRVNTNNKVVALTFDDAPSEYTDKVIAILKEKNIKATFYTIGQNIKKYPNQAKELVSQGHELGNHSYSHVRLVFKSPSFVSREVDKTNELIRSVGYSGEITFRPPNGKKLFILPWYLSTHNIKTIMWDVEPDTHVSGKPDEIIQYIVQNTKPGSTILIHPFCGTECEADREALPVIIDQLLANGYRFVTVSQLLGDSE